MKISSSAPPSAAASTAQSSNQNPESENLGMELERRIRELALLIARNISGVPDPKNNAACDKYMADQRTELDASIAASHSSALVDGSADSASEIIRLHAKHAAGGTAA